MNIKDNLYNLRQRAEAAAGRSGRNAEDVSIIAVSKTVDIPEVIEAYNNGQRLFGENRVQELIRKQAVLSELYPELTTGKDRIHWHLIGHLQSNKVKYIIDKVDLIHSVDSLELAAEIDRQAKKRSIIMPILLQVNISGEESKSGVDIEGAYDFVTEMSFYRNIKLKGLMTMAPYVTEQENTRIFFRNLKNLYVDISSKEYDNTDMEILSMGMSNDFEVAIEEGATMVRVGTYVFH